MTKSCFIVLSVLLRFTDPDYKFGIYLQTLSLEFQIKYVGAFLVDKISLVSPNHTQKNNLISQAIFII